MRGLGLELSPAVSDYFTVPSEPGGHRRALVLFACTPVVLLVAGARQDAGSAWGSGELEALNLRHQAVEAWQGSGVTADAYRG